MTSIIEESFGINLKIMRILCLYPPEKSTYLYKVQSYVFYFLFIVPIVPMGIIFFIVEENLDIGRIADSAFVIAYVALYTVKLFPFFKNGYKIKKCIHYMESPIFRISKKTHRNIINANTKICRTNSMVFLIFVSGGVTTWTIKPFFLNGYNLPVDIWLPFDPKTNSLTFYLIYLYLVTGVFYIAITTGTVDPLIGGLICLATGQIQILKNNLLSLRHYAEEEFSSKCNEKPYEEEIVSIMYDKIKQCVDLHQAILDFVKEFENCFSIIMFSQFFGSVVVICFCTLQLIMVEPMSFNFCTMISYILIVMTEIYFYCYYGTVLHEENNTIRDAIYISEWYHYDIKLKKGLIILIERSKKPMVVSAGKLLDLSLETFMMILRRSYSLLAVMKNYY